MNRIEFEVISMVFCLGHLLYSNVIFVQHFVIFPPSSFSLTADPQRSLLTFRAQLSYLPIFFPHILSAILYTSVFFHTLDKLAPLYAFIPETIASPTPKSFANKH